MKSTIVCADCKKETERRGAQQLCCPDCSRERDRARKAKYSRSRKGRANSARAYKKRNEKIAAGRLSRARELNPGSGIAWEASRPVGLLWLCRVAIPFSYRASKNTVWSFSHKGKAKGHVYARSEAKDYRAVLAAAISRSLEGRRVARNKLWLDILVEKPDHRGDAVNVIDLVCDAVQDATGLNDRWCCIKRLDWSVIKNSPRLFVGIGQESDSDVIVCSHCGRILEATPQNFQRNRNSELGFGRACKDCTRRR